MIAHSVRDQPVDRAFIDQLEGARRVRLPDADARSVDVRLRIRARPSSTIRSSGATPIRPAVDARCRRRTFQASNRTPAAATLQGQPSTSPRRTSSAEGRRCPHRDGDRYRTRRRGSRATSSTSSSSRWSQPGLTPMQVIVVGHCDAARCMKVADRIGTLKTGLEADFLVLGSNPLDDIRNTRSLESVWIHGVRVNRDEDAPLGTASCPLASRRRLIAAAAAALAWIWMSDGTHQPGTRPPQRGDDDGDAGAPRGMAADVLRAVAFHCRRVWAVRRCRDCRPCRGDDSNKRRDRRSDPDPGVAVGVGREPPR